MGRKSKGFWTLDAETDPFSLERNRKNDIPKPFVWGALHYPSEEYVEFTDTADVARFFEDKNALVYAHNGGKFDYHYLREFINSDEEILVIGGRLSKFSIGNSEFRDSLNLFQGTKLEQFGGKTKIDYALFEPDRRGDPNVDRDIRQYLRQDCQVLTTALDRYFSTYGKSLTQAGACMKYWEKHFNQTAPRQRMSDFQRYKPFYNGGRVQCFTEGVRSATFQVVDINSAYPFAMTHRHPISTVGLLRHDPPPINQYYKCLFKLRCTARACFPWRDDEGSLFFPDDEGGNRKRVRDYYVTGWEFLQAIALDAVSGVKILECHYFPETVCFKDYIDHFYNLRLRAKEAGDVMGSIFAKYFMNSLYGKFGQDVDNHEDYVIASSDSKADWLAKGYSDYKPWGDRRLLRRGKSHLAEDDPKRRYYNVVTAASITGFVRAHLYKSLDACSQPIYCDTDSVAARDTSGLQISNQLGDWKLEMECDQYAIAGKKLYAFRDANTGEYKTACKGVSLTAEEIIRVARGETIKYEPQVPTYSITREQPRYINRDVMKTYRDIAHVN